MWRPERSEGATHMPRGFQFYVDAELQRLTILDRRISLANCAFKRCALKRLATLGNAERTILSSSSPVSDAFSVNGGLLHD